MNYTAKQIAEITNSKLIGDENREIRYIAFDSRNIYSSQNTAFLAINTGKNSGEKYITAAIDKGVTTIISEHQRTDLQGITQIVVSNSIDFLHKLAAYHLLQFPRLKTIGITGSNGKTIVKEWLYQCISEDFDTVKSPKSFNSQLGLSISLLQISENNEVGIFEAGISKPGEMQRLKNIFPPKIGILTHIGSAHSMNFRDEEELIEEKISLFTSAELIIYNGDNKLVASKIKDKFKNKKLISYGLHRDNDAHIESDISDRGSDISVSYFGEKISFPAERRDPATLSNVLCVLCTLKILGFTSEKVIEKINHLKAVEMRLESANGLRNNLIINDYYNLDLDSLTIAYQFTKEYNKPKKALVLTDFVEGRNTDNFYRKVADLTNEQKFDQIFLVGKEITQYEKLFSSPTLTFASTSELIESQGINSISDSLILLKGARKFEIEKIKNFLELQKHDTVLEVNLNAILHNINVHKLMLKPETKMMAMVKAYSYGLGGYEIAEFLQHHHIDYLGVAYADEGVDLRKNGITTPIMVMNPEQHSYGIVIDYNLEPEIYSLRVLDLFCNQLKANGYQGKYPIHIKLETGMHRLGFKTNELPELAEKLRMLNVEVKSIFSHLSTADMPEEKAYAMKQLHIFKQNSDELIRLIGYTPLRHILNSSGITEYTDDQYDMVRIGIGMVGISPNPNIKKLLQNAVTFKTVISQISHVDAGESVGYSRKFKARENTKIATIPVGYADGVPRLIGNMVGKVGINHQLVPIVGNICMDMMMLDISNVQANEGDEVMIFNSTPTLEEFSEYCKTIPYEVLTSISRRVKRIYIKN